MPNKKKKINPVQVFSWRAISASAKGYKISADEAVLMMNKIN